MPLIARNLLESITLLSTTSAVFAERCVAGITADRERLARYAADTLASATALNPVIGYDAATALVEEAARSGRTLREVGEAAGIDHAALDAALDPLRLARGGRIDADQPR
ncbi:MAG: hypothetical protein R2695_18575 [Acidimicrobiales bacterium]